MLSLHWPKPRLSTLEKMEKEEHRYQHHLPFHPVSKLCQPFAQAADTLIHHSPFWLVHIHPLPEKAAPPPQSVWLVHYRPGKKHYESMPDSFSSSLSPSLTLIGGIERWRSMSRLLLTISLQLKHLWTKDRKGKGDIIYHLVQLQVERIF